MRIPFVRFPLVRSFKKFQNYSAHADSSIGARIMGGISMRWIKRMNEKKLGSWFLLLVSTLFVVSTSLRENWDKYSCHAFFNMMFLMVVFMNFIVWNLHMIKKLIKSFQKVFCPESLSLFMNYPVRVNIHIHILYINSGLDSAYR